MDFHKVIENGRTAFPESVKKKLDSLTEIEKKYLYELFDCKDGIDREMFALKVLDQTEQSLYIELKKTFEELFYQFFRKFCSNVTPDDKINELISNDLCGEDSDKFWFTLKSYKDVDKRIRVSFAKLIFENIDKEDIRSFLWNSWEWNQAFIDLVPACIDKFLDYLSDNLSWLFSDDESISEIIPSLHGLSCLKDIESEKDWLKNFLYKNRKSLMDEDLINKFFNYKKYKDILQDSFFDYLSDQSTISFNSIVYCIVFWILKSMDFSNVLYEYLDFYINKRHCFESFDEQEKDHYSSLYSGAKDLFMECFWLQDFEVEPIEGINFWTIKTRAYDDFAVLINRKLGPSLKFSEKVKFNDFIENNQERLAFEYIEQLYKTNDHSKKFFSFRTEYFLSKINSFLSDSSLFVLWDDEKWEIINELTELYPKARSEAWNVTVKKLNEIKKDFVSKKQKEVKDKFLWLIKSNSNFYEDFSMKNLMIILNLYMQFFNEDVKFVLFQEYQVYMYDYFKKRFEDSHNKAIKREEREAAKEEQKALDKKRHEELQIEKWKSMEPKAVETKKIELSEWFISDLEKYFWWQVDPDLLRSLRKFYWKYKTSWYTREKYWFDFDDGFFEILKRYWFICYDVVEPNDWENFNVPTEPEKSSDTSSEAEDEVDDPNILKLSVLIAKINETESFEEKVDYYVEALGIFYDFKNEKDFRVKVLNAIISENLIVKGIDSVLAGLLVWKKEKRKTSRREKRKRYYTFNIWNTWYRIVLQDQDNSDRKIIVDFVEHDTYLDRKNNSYLKKF